ncbi:glycosyltransferase family 2 protein [Pseudidiomarina andamanensis]|nr:glycosyltransferase family 2 protein [Pseudidiomarina andamanensis]MDS0217736.1 glycosyltransferase [Pseudidiomarina andamanensis]
MKVSVVIPTYNASKTIKHAVECLMSQTIKPFEIIIVDDGSKDVVDLHQILQSFNLSEIKLIEKHENTNAADSRNIGARNASGDVLCFLDADDYWYPQKLEKQLNALELSSIVSCRVRAVASDRVTALRVASEFDVTKTFCENLFGSLFHNLAFQTSTLMMRQEDFLRIGGFDSSLPRHQDYQFIINAEASGLKLRFVDDVLVDYVKSGKIAKIKHNWSLEKSLHFFDRYLLTENRKIRENFMIVQLLGPSIQAGVFSEWYKAACNRGLVSFSFLSKTLYYTVKRVIS